jgi:hypothetical protein
MFPSICRPENLPLYQGEFNSLTGFLIAVFAFTFMYYFTALIFDFMAVLKPDMAAAICGYVGKVSLIKRKPVPNGRAKSPKLAANVVRTCY